MAEQLNRKATRLLVIGLDAANILRFHQWMSEGLMPNLSRLKDEGVYLPMAGEGLSGAVWHSLYSGASVASHAQYFYNQIVPGSYRTRVRQEGDLPVPHFWEVLSQAGYRSIIVDAPKTRLSKALNGIQVINWAGHDPDAFNRFDCNHQRWKQRILQLPADPLDINDWGGSGPSDFAVFGQRLIANIQRRNQLNLALMNEEPWDLFFTCFDELHQAGHLGWHFQDPEHPRYDPGQAPPVKRLLKDIAAAMDTAIGALLESAGEDTQVIVFNSLGMGPNYTSKSLLDRFLGSVEGKPAGQSRNRSSYQWLSALWRQAPLSLQQYLLGFQIGLREALFAAQRGQQRFFSLPLNEDNSGIRINLAGREPKGKVKPGDYEAVCKELVDKLEQLRDADTGQPLAAKITRTHQTLSGERLSALPDIIIEWASEKPWKRAVWPHGEFAFHPHEYRTGSHRSGGFVLMRKAGNAAEQQTKALVAEPGVVSVRDLAATIYKHFGLSVKTDGRSF